MAFMRPCVKCGHLNRGQSYCDGCKPRNGSTRQWRLTRQLVLKRDGYRCTEVIDGERCPETLDLHVDHVQPKSKGGSDSMENLATLCGTHNLEKGDR